MKITAKITFYYNDKAIENELENFSVANTEIIAPCSNAKLDENFICFEYPKLLPESYFGHTGAMNKRF